MTEKMPPFVPSDGHEDTPQQTPGHWVDGPDFKSEVDHDEEEGITVVSFEPHGPLNSTHPHPPTIDAPAAAEPYYQPPAPETDTDTQV